VKQKSLQEFKFHTRSEAQKASLKVVDVGYFSLIPVGEWILNDTQLISEFARWRSMNSKMFFSQFPESVEGMREYLTDLSIGDSSYLLFVVFDDLGQALGHLGLKSVEGIVAEIDSVMKSPDCKIPGLMDCCLKVLISFADRVLNLKELQLEVISYNTRAIDLYLANGFEEFVWAPLHRIEDDGRIDHVKVQYAEANVDYFSITMTRVLK
jgi:RimJ/RimL family protein N-acetyltransferase